MIIPHSIQIVLVVYETKLEDSLSFQTFCKYKKRLLFSYDLLIYNNSPEIVIPTSENYTIYNADSNDMLAGAYNYALERAIKYERKWLLLLDQDTDLSEEYFVVLNTTLATELNVAAIFPMLKHKEKHLSPHSYSPFGGHWGKVNDITKTGIISNKTVAAFNSATMLSVAALQKIEGFPKEFPLYELDYSVFYRLSKNKESFYLMNVSLQHDLTMLDYKNKMTKARYYSIIDAENKFAKQIGIWTVIIFKIKLCLRFGKQIVTNAKRKYASITLKYLCK